MSKISIPEPCHENWAEFTPTEQGAFCGSCQIDVIDFSSKSPIEIKSILKENAGKHLCGRFKKTQLVELNDDFFAWQNQSVRSLQSKFLYACLVVFGMTLFTGCETNQHVVGEMYYEAPIEQTNEPENPNSNQEIIHPSENNGHKKGKFKIEPEVDAPIKSCETNSIVDEREFTKGDIAYIPREEEKFLGQIVVLNTEIEPVHPDTLSTIEETVEGGLKIDSEYLEFLEDTSTSIKAPEIITPSSEIINLIPDFEGKLFPNPSSERATIELKINHEGHFEVYLYSMEGKRIKPIYYGNLTVGDNRFNIDISTYKSGTYLVVVNSEKQKETFKLEKVK